MGITLKTFMALYNSKKSDEDKEQLIREHIIGDYIPYEKKADIANAIVDISYWKKEKDFSGLETKILYVDSVAKYMLTCMAMLDLFTDIERKKNNGNMLEDFNLLNSNGIFDILAQNIDERELKEFNMILQMICDDVITNEYENHAFITKQIDRFGRLIGASIAPILENIDINQIMEMIKDNVE